MRIQKSSKTMGIQAKNRMDSLKPSISPGETFNASPWRAPGLPMLCQKEEKKLQITADILWSLPSAPWKSLANTSLAFIPGWTCRVPYNDKEINYSQIKLAVCLGFLNNFLLTNIPICPLRSMSYNDTRRELQKGPLRQSQFNQIL